ncbi:MAG: rhodanese-like domain-containing protein [Alphaproteobacteria bacterium]|nr:rhodanese-like domain-containing protein [Alphaproteobacteria bacterium]MDH5556720.1 rhodanese-like domain-containing protein [Alphaproteobacteria bacterium]
MSAVQTVDANTLSDWIAKNEVLLIDVREPNEHARAHIPAAVLMPLSKLGGTELPDAGGKKVAVVCASGARSAMAAERLFAQHYDNVHNLHGGMMAWKMAGLEVAQNPCAASNPLGGLFSMFRSAG